MIDEQIRSEFTYDKETGEIIRKGKVCGEITIWGYRRIRIGRHRYFAHRLAWFLATGDWPSGEIDHINRDKLDNRISNLRIATRSQNQANRSAQSNNALGIKGVKYRASRKAYAARIYVNGKEKWIGSYKTIHEAQAAYMMEAIRIFGEFAHQ